MKIVLKRDNYKEKIYRFLGINMLRIQQTVDESGKKHKRMVWPFSDSAVSHTKMPVFYLKVNRICDYAFLCLQNWIDIIHKMGGDFYIICDKPLLTKLIYKKICFYNEDIKIICSYKRQFNSFVHNLADTFWIKAANAHLSTYWHAKQNNISSFWNIDADDTMLLLDVDKTAKILKDVANYAEEHDISNMALDMWRSRTAGKQWSFGVTYTRMNIDYFDIFKKEKNLNWKYYRTDGFSLDTVSLDCYFTYCRDVFNMKNETFYVENSQFIHWGEFLTAIFQSGVCKWSEGVLSYPILANIVGDTEFSKTSICSDCIKFQYDITDEDAYKIMQEKFIYSLGEKAVNFLRKYYN